MGSGILVLASQRELRRVLFDVLDRQGHPAIHSARDVAHAAILLEGRDPLALLVVVLAGDDREAQRCCQQLRAMPACAEAPLIAVLVPEGVLRPSQLPETVGDWLDASRIEAELVERWRRLRPVVVTAVAQTDEPLALQEGEDDEWLLTDPAGERVWEISPALLRRMGIGAQRMLGRAVNEQISFEDGVSVLALAVGDRRWHACRRRSAFGFEQAEAAIRPARHAGRDGLAVVFRSRHAEDRPLAALNLLMRLFDDQDDGGLAGAAQLLADGLGLDYLAVWSARPEENGTPMQRYQWWRGEEPAWPEASVQTSLRLVLGGRTLLHPQDAARLAADDPLIRQLGLLGFAGLPLVDERRSVLGALLAGARRPMSEPEVVEPVLRCAAAHFAHVLELQRTREQGRAEGLLDALTGLPNRLLLNDRLDTVIREANRTGECFALLFVDLDRFKSINDNLGHAMGDQVLVAVTQRLIGSVRASDTVARYAGDEFIVVLRHIVKNEDAARVAEKIVQAMAVPLQLEQGPELHITISIGISFFPDDATDAETLLKHADDAMYAAKSRGRNSFQIYEVSPEQARQQNLALKSRLRLAEQNNELRVVYQPQVDAANEDIVGMEALLRWEHPELGSIGPAFFIPIAEESGLIVPMGEWVLRTACLEAQGWEQKYGLRLRLGVNLSAMQLLQPGLLETVSSVLTETGLDPGLLELEVTESISVKQMPNLVENLHGLHRLGCRIAIDDFGTGAASLDYLRRLPADRIKIDQSFVRNIGVDPDDEAIVRAIVDMAHRLKRGVVAEGVETEQHLHFLRANHCDELQGYLFCRPLTSALFDQLLAERQSLLAARA